MLIPISDRVSVHVSEFLDSNAVVVRGDDGVLLVDPGITADELAGIAQELDTPVVAGFSTHPHWDHVLWHPDFGDVPRYGTASNAARMEGLLGQEGWRDRVAGVLPADLADRIPVDGLFGRITGLPAGTERVPWAGPGIRIIEHRGHVDGHAALFIEDEGVLIAGDMLSDTLIPFLDGASDDPVGDSLAALDRFAALGDRVRIVIPGHGSVGEDAAARIALDRAYLAALRDGTEPQDPRLEPTAPHGEWLPGVHERQAQQVREKPKG